jgi:hypothetical protein
MGSYNSDSHNVQRHVAEGGIVLNEGDVQVPVQPYQIPYRVLLPKKAEAENLLVPVCFSASHIAYSSLRMEPQYMILGHAAGAAALAIKSRVAVQDVPVPELPENSTSGGWGVRAELRASTEGAGSDSREVHAGQNRGSGPVVATRSHPITHF